MIKELVGTRSFTLTSSNDKPSRLRQLMWRHTSILLGTPSFPHLHPWSAKHCLQKVWARRSSNHACWLSLASSETERSAQKRHLTVGKCLQTWKLIRSAKRTVSAVFHLNNKVAKRELKLNFNHKAMPFCCEPKYLGLKLDRTLIYHWVADTSSHFAKSGHHTSHLGGLSIRAGVLGQQRHEQPPWPWSAQQQGTALFSGCAVRDAGTAGGQWKGWGQWKLAKNKNIMTNCACFHAATMLTSKIIAGITENHSEFSGCANSCNKYVSSRSG